MTELGVSVVACIGCGGQVPDEDGPIHRYMTSSPGCWRTYTELAAAGWPPSPRAPLAVDAYAATHPGVAGRQSTPSVWIHLVALCLLLERAWPVERGVAIRRVAADAFEGWPWLEPPPDMGATTVVDVARAIEASGRGSERAVASVDGWVGSAWGAWSIYHAAIRRRADDLVARFFS
jgi:Family of unknown function (DUF5946)